MEDVNNTQDGDPNSRTFQPHAHTACVAVLYDSKRHRHGVYLDNGGIQTYNRRSRPERENVIISFTFSERSSHRLHHS